MGKFAAGIDRFLGGVLLICKEILYLVALCLGLFVAYGYINWSSLGFAEEPHVQVRRALDIVHDQLALPGIPFVRDSYAAYPAYQDDPSAFPGDFILDLDLALGGGIIALEDFHETWAQGESIRFSIRNTSGEPLEYFRDSCTPYRVFDADAPETYYTTLWDTRNKDCSLLQQFEIVPAGSRIVEPWSGVILGENNLPTQLEPGKYRLEFVVRYDGKWFVVRKGFSIRPANIVIDGIQQTYNPDEPVQFRVMNVGAETSSAKDGCLSAQITDPTIQNVLQKIAPDELPCDKNSADTKYSRAPITPGMSVSYRWTPQDRIDCQGGECPVAGSIGTFVAAFEGFVGRSKTTLIRAFQFDDNRSRRDKMAVFTDLAPTISTGETIEFQVRNMTAQPVTLLPACTGNIFITQYGTNEKINIITKEDERGCKTTPVTLPASESMPFYTWDQRIVDGDDGQTITYLEPGDYTVHTVASQGVLTQAITGDFTLEDPFPDFTSVLEFEELESTLPLREGIRLSVKNTSRTPVEYLSRECPGEPKFEVWLRDTGRITSSGSHSCDEEFVLKTLSPGESLDLGEWVSSNPVPGMYAVRFPFFFQGAPRVHWQMVRLEEEMKGIE